MGGKSNYLEGKILNWLKGTAFGTAPAGLYVGLFTADPTDAGATTDEVTTTVRAAGRPAVSLGTLSSGTGADTLANSAIVDFGAAAGAPGSAVTHVGIFDAASAGNMLYSAALTTPRTVTVGAAVSFPIGAIVISEN